MILVDLHAGQEAVALSIGVTATTAIFQRRSDVDLAWTVVVVWDLPAVPARREQRQVHRQHPTYSERSIGQELRPQLGRYQNARL